MRPIERYRGAGVDRAESASEASRAAVALKGQLPTLGRLNNDGSPYTGGNCCGYTKGMKTAVSIPDEVFEGAERLARRTKKSRSQLFSDALKEYVARHASEDVTEAMDRVCGELGNRKDEFVSSAARRIFERSEW